jgi:hypothetical protein
MIRSPTKFHLVSIKLFGLMLFSVILSGAILAIKSIVEQKSEIFQSIDRFPNINRELIDRAIVAGVKLDRQVTLAYVQKNLTMMELDSGGDRYIILRVVLPETCGQLGCLYIVKSKGLGMAKLLQLQELSSGEQMFVSTVKTGCFEVIQTIDRARKNFPICEENR